ncbi:MAG: TldD/PmbA family protein, partial [Ardenticatenia bacterium]
IKNLRFTQSYVEALQNVVALSRERRTLASFGTVGAMKVPAAVIRNFTFTGKTQF